MILNPKIFSGYIQQTNAVFSLSDIPENTDECVTGNSLHEQLTDGLNSNDSIKVNNYRKSLQKFSLVLY